MIDATGGTFVYVTFIRTTPQKLWSALIDPEIIDAAPRPPNKARLLR